MFEVADVAWLQEVLETGVSVMVIEGAIDRDFKVESPRCFLVEQLACTCDLGAAIVSDYQS